MHVSGATTVCGIIGDPVEHSLSPVMQNAAFEAVGLDFVYVPLRVARGCAGMGAQAMRTLGLRGLNVTVPHKVDILPYLDWIDGQAGRIGAVNTIVNQDGRLLGYNTDAAGFMQGLAAQDVCVTGLDVVVMGAGGAARAVAFSLCEAGARLTLLNRDAGKAAALARDVSSVGGSRVASGELTDASLETHLAGAALLVNTTSVGMHPHEALTPCPVRLLRRDLVVCDIVYNPRETQLLRDAAGRGAMTIAGVEMLVHQGARAFELWAGVPAPVGVMRAAVTKELARVVH